MPWVRIDDDFPDHPKLAQMGDMAPLAGWQFVCILAYCNRYLTDGHIGKAKAHDLVAWHHVGVETGGIKDIAAFGEDVDGVWACLMLEGSRLLEACPEHADCYLVHDYQPSRAQVLAEREKTAERVRRHRERRNPVTNGVGNGVSNGAPVPVPVPVPVGSPNGLPGDASEKTPKPAKRPARPRREPEHTPQAETLTKELWSSLTTKPVAPNPYVVVRQRVDELLVSGRSEDEVRRVLPHIDVWTRPAIELVLSRMSGNGSRRHVPDATPEPVYRRIE